MVAGINIPSLPSTFGNEENSKRKYNSIYFNISTRVLFAIYLFEIDEVVAADICQILSHDGAIFFSM